MIVALTRLHYGADYLDAVIRSTEGFADLHIILYTERPNFGHLTDLPCPDSREELQQIAEIAGGDRLRWVDHPEPGVAAALARFQDVELLLELDGDEVIHQDLAADILTRYQAGDLTIPRYRLPMVHHWRSFGYTCTDGQWPVRLYVPGQPGDETDWYPNNGRYIHHFGYARKLVDMRYKWAVSLHGPEMRPGWWEDIFTCFPERLEDLHPVSDNGFWKAEPFPDSGLPAVLISHPYRGLEVIE